MDNTTDFIQDINQKLIDNAIRMRDYHAELIDCYKYHPELAEYHREQVEFWQGKVDSWQDELCKR